MLWIGETRNPVKVDRRDDFVMDSIIEYYDSPAPRTPYIPGKLFLDSGAFTARRQGMELKKNRVIEIQETFMPDRAVPLDHPFLPEMSVPTMLKCWEKTKENVVYWQSSTKLEGRITPVLHAWSKRSLVSNLRWLVKMADTDMLLLGSLVNPSFSGFSGFFGDRQPRRELVDMISLGIEAVKKYSDFRVHLTGFGSSPLTLHLAYYLGVDSTDTAGSRRKAAYGKIILNGTGERYVSNKSTKFGNVKIADDLERTFLEKCDCPVCRSNPDRLTDNWKARAIHNEHVLEKESELAQDLLKLGEDAYETYLDRFFQRSGLSYLWEYAKKRRKFARISESLF